MDDLESGKVRALSSSSQGCRAPAQSQALAWALAPWRVMGWGTISTNIPDLDCFGGPWSPLILVKMSSEASGDSVVRDSLASVVSKLAG